MVVLVDLQVNTGTNASPSWSTITASEKLVFTTSDMTDSTTDANIPFITKPASGTTTAERLYWGTSGEYTCIITYHGHGTGMDRPNDNENVIRWSWDAAMNSAPEFTACLDTVTHSAATAGNETLLGGTTNETVDKSHLKAVICDGSLSASWCTAGTGSIGEVTTTNTGQSLNGFYSEDNSNGQTLKKDGIPSGADNEPLALCMFVSASLTETGTVDFYLSCKFTYT